MTDKQTYRSGDETYFAHVASSFLLESTQIGQKIIKTSMGNFRIRKNGKILLTLDRGKDNEETVRVTRMKP